MSDFNDVVALFADHHDSNLIEDLLYGLTTDKERQEMAQRIEIVKRLLAGEPQHKIAADLHVGVATVTRGSKEIAQGRFKVLRSDNPSEHK